MAGANQRLDQQLARLRLEPGNILFDSDIVRIGEAAVGMVLRLAMLGLYDQSNARPAIGVLGEPGGLDSHLGVSKGTGDLQYDVATGAAFVYDSAGAEDEFTELDYRLAALGTAIANNSVGAHHATLPRIDVVSITPVDATDIPENRTTRNVTTGNPTIPDPTVNVRTRASGTIVVTAGTPNASPTAPATPTGNAKLAEIAVPATSGPIVVTDFRDFVGLTEAFRGLPPNWMTQNHAISGFTVTGTTSYAVARGLFTFGGLVRRYAGATAQSFGGLPGGTNERVDLISLTPTAAGGTLVRTAGTNVDTTAVDGGEPLPPTLPAGDIAIAEVRLNSAGVMSITNILEVGPIGTAQIRRRAITTDKVARATRTILLPASAFSFQNSANVTVSIGGSKLAGVTGGGGAGQMLMYSDLRLPIGTKILEVGWMAFETAGTVTMQGACTRNLMLPAGATQNQQTIAADGAAVGLNATITVNSPALDASEDPEVVKSRWGYGISVVLDFAVSSGASFLGAYAVVEGPELAHLGEAGDVS